MTNDKPTVQYQDIDDTPARDLLALSHTDLNALIRQAERIEEHAQNITHWLRGIQVEKSLRERFDDHGKGGDA